MERLTLNCVPYGTADYLKLFSSGDSRFLDVICYFDCHPLHCDEYYGDRMKGECVMISYDPKSLEGIMNTVVMAAVTAQKKGPIPPHIKNIYKKKP